MSLYGTWTARHVVHAREKMAVRVLSFYFSAFAFLFSSEVDMPSGHFGKPWG